MTRFIDLCASTHMTYCTNFSLNCNIKTIQVQLLMNKALKKEFFMDKFFISTVLIENSTFESNQLIFENKTKRRKNRKVYKLNAFMMDIED